MLHGPVYQTSHMKNKKKNNDKMPMREERFAMIASVVMLIILGIGVLGFAIG